MWTGELSACDTVALSRVFEMVARTTSPAPSRSILVMGMAKPPVRCLPSNAATSTTQSGSVRPGRADAVLARAVGRGDDEFRPHPSWRDVAATLCRRMRRFALVGLPRTQQ
jgi:hypothetical protein